MFVGFGNTKGVAQLPIGSGIVMGDFFVSNVKGKGLFIQQQWDLVNADIKAAGFEHAEESHPNLAAAFGITEDEAKQIEDKLEVDDGTGDQV